MAKKPLSKLDSKDQQIALLNIQVRGAHEVIKALLAHKGLANAKINAIEGVTCQDCGTFAELKHQFDCPISRAWRWEKMTGGLL